MAKRLIDISDKALMAEIARGNRLAFNAVFDRYWSKLFRAAFNLLRDEELAKDVVQEVLFDFWNRRDQHEIDNLQAYFYQATRFQSLKQLRKAKLLDIHDEVFASVLTVNTTQEQLDFRQLEEELGRSLNRLPEKYREVFELSRVHNLTNKEIADRLEISQRTVDWYLYHTLKRLKTSLITAVIALLGPF